MRVVSWVAKLAQKRCQPRRHDVKSNIDVNVIAEDDDVISQRIEHDFGNRHKSDVIFDTTDDVIRQNSQFFAAKFSKIRNNIKNRASSDIIRGRFADTP